MRIPFFSRPDWQNPDWRIREQAAFQLRDQTKLLFLAIQDVSEEVRVAASKSLRDDKHRAQLVRNGYCEHARRLAVAAIHDPATLLAILHDRSVPAALRVAAGGGVRLPQGELLAFATNEVDVELRAWAIGNLEKSAAANSLYSTALPSALQRVLIPKLTDKTLLAQIVATHHEVSIQSLALAELTDEIQLTALFAKLEDAGLRRQIVDRVNTPALLQEMLAEADEEPVRIYLVEHLQDQAMLSRIALADHLPSVRIAAVRKLKDASTAVAVANGDADRRVRLAALESVADETAFAAMAVKSDDEQLRWRAVERIQSEEVLRKLQKTAPHPDVRWQVGRKLGEAPLDDFFAIANTWTLRRLAETESVPILQQMAVRLMPDRHVVETLATSPLPIVSEAAHHVLQITAGPGEISFVPIPGRPYEFSLFVLTQSQIQALLGEDPRWSAGGEMPATGVTLQEAKQICGVLSRDGIVYRLPSFEEWLHATTAGDKTWFTPPANSPIEAWTFSRLHLNASGPRPARRAWPNPWGLLDAVGNVAVWVDEDPGPTAWISFNRERDALASGGSSAEIHGKDYAVAAGPHWADVRLKQARWERLVRVANLAGYGRDKVGVRLVRAKRAERSQGTEYRLVLETEPRWGLTPETVIAALVRATIYSQDQLEKFYRVAPIAVLASPDYEFVRKLQSVFRRCGADVTLASKAAETTKGAEGGEPRPPQNRPPPPRDRDATRTKD